MTKMRERSRKQEIKRKQERILSTSKDRLIAPPRAKVPYAKNGEYSQPAYSAASACDACSHVDACRQLVCSGKQVLCGPIYESDIRLEYAYNARRAMAEV